jgi:alpha-beta hydrolase superfamily lysophospholipase
MPTDSFKTRDGLTLYTEYRLPQDDPKAVVLLVHGYAEHCGRYAHVIARLVDAGYAVYTMDHRGHGKSEGTRAYIDTMDQFIEDLKLYFDRVKAAQATFAKQTKRFVLGHSMGALIGLAFTERYQSEIDGLVISGAPVNADANVSPLMVALGNLLTRVAPKLPLLPMDKPGILCSDPEVESAFGSDPLNYTAPMRVRLGVELNKMARGVREHLRDLTLPVLILHGADDIMVNPSGSQLAYDTVSSADKTLKFYPGMRHEIMNEIGKETVLNEIVAWMDRHL